MKRCRMLAEVGRRQFLRGGAATAAGVAATLAPTGQGHAASPAATARMSYPANRLANLADLQENTPLEVAYPDADAPGVLLKLGKPVPGGAGPGSDIVGFSTICPHKGYPLRYDQADRSFSCSGHYSRFDAEKGGLEIWGHATQNLPQYILRVDEKGDVYAEGLDELLYGRFSNVLG